MSPNQVSNFDYDVFLSFASHNEGLARSLYERLRLSGLRVFWSDESLKKRVGQSWFRVVEESLDRSKHLVLLWTEEAKQSKFVRMEYEAFRVEAFNDNNRLLIPLFAYGFGPEKMPLFMRTLQCYSLEQDLKDLISCVGGRYEPLESQNASLRKEIKELKQQINVLKKNQLSGQEPVEEDVQAELEELKFRNARLEEATKKTTVLIKEKDLQIFDCEERLKELENRSTKDIARKPPKPFVFEPDRYLTDEFGIEFVLIKQGKFIMGSEYGEENEKPIHKVEINNPFYLSRYPITQSQWLLIEGSNPSQFKGETLPVEQVSWNNVQEFLKKLNSGGTVYRLPTEAEWEYACRAGTTTEYSFGENEDRLAEYAWYNYNSNSKTHSVGEKKPNPIGLYDMHGNVYEWVQDWYGQYVKEAVIDPKGPETVRKRVVRGGGWGNTAPCLRSAFRGYLDPSKSDPNIGFRLVRSFS